MSENMYKLQYELNIQPCNCIKYGTSWFQIIQSSISYCNNFYSNLTPIIFSDDPMAVPSFLHEHKLLPDSCECTHCKKPMVLRKRPTKDTTDDYGWQLNFEWFEIKMYHTLYSSMAVYLIHIAIYTYFLTFHFRWAIDFKTQIQSGEIKSITKAKDLA
jgi:hypothetical protein